MGLGKLVLKGGEEVKGVSKKKSRMKKDKTAAASVVAAVEAKEGDAEDADEPSTSGAAQASTAKPPPKLEYEKEFKFETARMEEGKARSTAWGATYKAPPNILHGYDRKVQGDTFEERLDLRCAKKADRMCK